MNRYASSVIFYGAGEKAEFYTRILKKRGISPICFVDRNEFKQGTTICGKEILSLNKALQLYPNSQIFITVAPERWNSVSKYLVGTGLVAEERILNFQIGKKYKGCYNIENQMALANNGITFCCVPNNQPRMRIETNNIDISKEFIKFRADTIAQINSDSRDGLCSGCSHFSDNYWVEEGNNKINRLELNFESICNFDCIYCVCEWRDNKMSNQIVPDYAAILDNLDKANLLDNEGFEIYFGGGEPTLLPNADVTFRALGKYQLLVFTNGSIFNKELANALQANQKSCIVSSVDAGTRETFMKIKQRDCFKIVCENLEKYTYYGKVILKYIFLPGINDNDIDIRGFVALCDDMKINEVRVARDIYAFANKEQLPNNTINAMKCMVGMLKEKGISTKAMGEMSQKDLEELML